MEPFGLFQFLQSLLNSPAPTSQPLDETPTVSTPDPPPVSPLATEQKGNETYLKFISAHEARIQKTRK
jgi:hypothetical protein